MTKPSKEDDRFVYRVCELFLNGMMAADIAKEVGRTRESIYPILAEGRKREFIKLVPPLETTVASLYRDRFKIDPSTLHVVDAPRESVDECLGATGAEVAISIIKKLGQAGRDPVHLGLGPGRISRLVSKFLGPRLRAEAAVPRLCLHAITAGCPSASAEYSPLAFFSFFERNRVETTYGFFTDAVVHCSSYKDTKKLQGFTDAMAQRDQIDIIFTSLGDATDEHDLFRILLGKSSPDAIDWLKKQGWVGNVQYRPYSVKGAIQENSSAVRVPTLFEIEDLKRWASQKGKHVILFVHPCGICHMRRTRALKPLLEVADLKVWSELVIDAGTASEVLLLPESKTSSQGDSTGEVK